MSKDLNMKNITEEFIKTTGMKLDAIELASELESYYWIPDDEVWIKKAATMLRQQQAEIEALKQIIDANNLSQNIGQFVKPTNKPVAWMIKTLDGRSLMLYGEEQPPKFKEDVQYIPLYTHPVKEQDESFDRTASHMAGEYVAYKAELTDEEIIDIALKEVDGWVTKEHLKNFARAILRKAQK
jgi:hypothetical protein